MVNCSDHYLTYQIVACPERSRRVEGHHTIRNKSASKKFVSIRVNLS